MTSGIIWYLILFPVQVAIIVSSVSFLQNQRSYRRELERQAEEGDKADRLHRPWHLIAVLEAEVNVPLDVLIRAAEEEAEREYQLSQPRPIAVRSANAGCLDYEFEAIYVLESQEPIAWIETHRCDRHATESVNVRLTTR